MSTDTLPDGEANKCACRRGCDDNGAFHVVICRSHFGKIGEEATATDADWLARQVAASLHLIGDEPVAKIRTSLIGYASVMRRNALEEAARRMEHVNEIVPHHELEFINIPGATARVPAKAIHLFLICRS
ncbi:MAG TPA: hypothetical protein VHB50_03930 [Bryobacteraceae bacterium]|nr:hypothetical protein [Bryobacteraceae bacterium]